MKKTFLLVLLLALIGTSGSFLSMGSDNTSEDIRDIALQGSRSRPYRLPMPDITASIDEEIGLLTISVNKYPDSEMTISISNAEDGVIYTATITESELFQVPLEIPILLDLDESKTYLLEIETYNFFFSGEF